MAHFLFPFPKGELPAGCIHRCQIVLASVSAAPQTLRLQMYKYVNVPIASFSCQTARDTQWMHKG